MKKITIFYTIFCITIALHGSVVDDFENAIKGKTGNVSQAEIDAAKKVAAISWDNPKELGPLRDEGKFKKLIDLIIAPSFYDRPGAKAVLESLFKSPVFAGENAMYVAGALDGVLDFLLTKLESGSSLQVQQDALDLLTKLDLSFVGIGAMKKGNTITLQPNPNFKPMERLIAIAQAKNSKPLFDIARSYFARNGNYKNYASTIVKEMATRLFANESVNFAWFLINNFLDMSLVPEGNLKDAVKKLVPGAFLRTIEKAMKELEDVVDESKIKNNDELVKAHARKVAQFPGDAVQKSPEKDTLNKRTLKVMVTLLASNSQCAAEAVDILLEGKTISDINEKVLIDGELKQLLPLYITHVAQRPGVDVGTVGANLLKMVDVYKADTAVPVLDNGVSKPIYTYLAENTVKDEDLFGGAMFAAFRRVSPAGVKEYGEKESGFVENQVVANVMLKTLATQAIKKPESVKGATIPEYLAKMVDQGANHRLIPEGEVRKKVKKQLDIQGKYEAGVNLLGKKDSTIPEKPTQKNTVKETIEAIKADVQKGAVDEAKELVEDLKFLALEGDAEVVKKEKLDKPLEELLSLPSILKVLPQPVELVKTLEDKGALVTGKQLEEKAKLLQPVEFVETEEKAQSLKQSESNLRNLATALRALI